LNTNIEKKNLSKEITSLPPGESFQNSWDINIIENVIDNAMKSDTLPNFSLGKVEIHPSGNCNLRCPFCYGQNLAPTKKTDLPLGVMHKIINDLNNNFSDEEKPIIVFAGMYSEPMLHSEMKEIIYELGLHSFRFGIYTNGLLLNQDIISVIVESAKNKFANKKSYISFDVTASLIVDQFYKKLFPIIKKTVDYRNKENANLQINTPVLALLGKSDHTTLFPVIEKLSSIGVDNIRLSFPWALHEAGEVEKYGFLPREEYYKAVKIFQELKQEFSNITIREPQLKPFDHCFMIAQCIAISPEGDVYPCPEVCAPLYKNKFSYGSVLKNGILEIWRSQKHQKIFNDLNPRNENCICCPVDWKFNELCAKFWPPKLDR